MNDIIKEKVLAKNWSFNEIANLNQTIDSLATDIYEEMKLIESSIQKTTYIRVIEKLQALTEESSEVYLITFQQVYFLAHFKILMKILI